ncbi:hypothetical protein [Streptomyces mexicanus]|uniref:hypothetical protein n=1 Tax=Streptomyces mexicanus TaxID=178566 RepID=UPI0031F0933B
MLKTNPAELPGHDGQFTPWRGPLSSLMPRRHGRPGPRPWWPWAPAARQVLRALRRPVP